MARAKKIKRTKASAPESSTDIDPRFAAVMAAFADDRLVTSGKMMASVGLRVKGKTFSMMVKGRFVAKLPRSRVDELVERGLGEYFDPRAPDEGVGGAARSEARLAGDGDGRLSLREGRKSMTEAARR